MLFLISDVALFGRLWDEYQRYRIDRETSRLYPHRELVAKGMAA
jgi:hypothetical protein